MIHISLLTQISPHLLLTMNQPTKMPFRSLCIFEIVKSIIELNNFNRITFYIIYIYLYTFLKSKTKPFSSTNNLEIKKKRISKYN